MSAPIRRLPGWVDYGLLPLINVAMAFAVAGLVVLMVGENPFEVVRIMIAGAFGYGEGIGYTLFYTTNFIFTGLAFAVAMHAGLFNIGAEGQAYMAGIGLAFVCLALDQLLPWWLVAPLALIGAAAFGAGWAFIPAYLQAKRGSHVVITTIMFNFIAATLVQYLLVNVLRKQGSMQPETRTFEAGGHLPKMQEALSWVGIEIARSPLNLAFVVAVLACIFVWVLIWRSKLGYEMRTVGYSPAAATYAGISTTRITIIALMISGGLAGLMAMNEIMGEQHRMLLDYTSGYGFVGIAVALMGRNHPVGIALAALLFGVLYQGGAELAFEIPAITRDMIIAIQALVILFAGALEHMFRPALARIFARPERVATA
ncbi:MAG: sugar ABC transporter permease [Hyphomicrobiales bacterium]|nr:MAG: sugar ABC transporter permease [Hyphomicrobiales bacterium]